jgi:hypothetical protein
MIFLRKTASEYGIICIITQSLRIHIILNKLLQNPGKTYLNPEPVTATIKNIFQINKSLKRCSKVFSCA